MRNKNKFLQISLRIKKQKGDWRQPSSKDPVILNAFFNNSLEQLVNNPKSELSHIELLIFKTVKDQKYSLKLYTESSEKSLWYDCPTWYHHIPVTFLKSIAEAPKSPQTFIINNVNDKISVSKPAKHCSNQPNSKSQNVTASWIIVTLMKITLKTLINI